MSFNLNKNDGSKQNDPADKSKFDLSKNAGLNVGARSKKPQYLMLILLALIILGGGAWYFTARNANGNLAPNDSTSLSATNLNQNKAVIDTMQSSVSVTPDSMTASSAAAIKQAPNQIAASFNRGSASLAKISGSVVKDIVELSKINGNGTISINGYASSEGDLAVNLKISQFRADSFKKYLVSKGVSENKITAIGRGIENPIASNDTEAGREKNRRVEVIIQ